METQTYISDMIFDDQLYTISWSDIENAEPDYENYLNDIENFFRENSENDCLMRILTTNYQVKFKL